MRQVKEARVWSELKKSRKDDARKEVSVDGISIDLSEPCTVIAGRNGTGKSRLLRSLSEHPDISGVFIDLHSLCEKALEILRSRDDFEEMKNEYERFGPVPQRYEDIVRIVGREYDHIDWYALEVEPGDPELENRFRWASGSQSLLPYFETSYRDVSYSARNMGLGEFSVHFLFWIIEQYRDADNLTLLLDEPDAYLPPVASAALLARVQRICLDRRWSLVVTTHSTEVIEIAKNHSALAVLKVDSTGASRATHVRDDAAVADTLLNQPRVRYEFFVEDESAYYLAVALAQALGRDTLRTIAFVWGRGASYMEMLQQHLPVSPKPAIGHAYVFDGDQRDKVPQSKLNQWPAIFLPTNEDPDSLFKSAGNEVQALATRLGERSEVVSREIESLEGLDPHDWVNELGVRFGRPQFLTAIAEIWVNTNPVLNEEFVNEIRKTLIL